MRSNFLKLLDIILVLVCSTLSGPYCQFACRSVCMYMYVPSFIRGVVRDNVISNDIAITSALRSNVIIFETNSIFS